MFATSCSNEEAVNDQQVQSGAEISGTATGIKTVAYVEVNDINPLNAGSYYMDGNAFYDYVIIFAANIRGVGNDAVLHFNENITAILGNPNKYIVPLQNKGIKVLLSVLGDHTGLGFANLTDAQAEQFATALANAVTTYNLDGIDLDDEYAKYGTNGYPAANSTSYSNLVNKLRGKLAPGKLITVFDWDYSNTLGAAVPSIDYAWSGHFGGSTYYSTTIPGLPNSKWSPQAINLRGINSATAVKTKSTQAVNAGMGAIMTYDLRNTNHTTVLNAIGTGAFNKTVTYNGESFSKDW